jgi:hypothetical protein
MHLKLRFHPVGRNTYLLNIAITFCVWITAMNISIMHYMRGFAIFFVIISYVFKGSALFWPKPPTIKFYKVPFSDSPVLCRRTDIRNLLVTNSYFGSECQKTPNTVYSCFGEWELDLYINEYKYIRFQTVLSKAKQNTYWINSAIFYYRSLLLRVH